MKIFKISQTENRGYDTYDSAVVIAEDENEAKQMNPGGKFGDRFTGWCSSPEQVSVEELGEANYSYSSGFICTSFNAG